MDKFGKSQSVKRVEDQRFLRGNGAYVDDIAPKGALRCFVLRSPVAHGTLAPLDVSDAREAEGVALVLTAEDLAAAGIMTEMHGERVKTKGGGKGVDTGRPLLASGKVRYVGEPLAMIVAETIEAAKDAAELIAYDIDDLPAHTAIATGGEPLHAAAPDNRAFDFSMGDEAAVDAALAASAHVISVEVPDNRIIVNSLEPRGVTAEMVEGRLHVAVNGQGVWGPRDQIAKQLKMDKADVRVTNPDTGGGFGMKGMPYPEMYLAAQATRMLGRPVHWMSERTEAMLSDNAGRDLVSTATLGFDADHRITAYKVETLANMGAYNSHFAQFIQSELFTKVMPGTYDISLAYLGSTGVYTNSTPVDAYRGAGRPEAIFVLERAMDHAARQLGLDPHALRRINFIRPDQFPYTSATGMAYDVGEFDKVLTRAEAKSDRAGFAARRAGSEAKGRLRGYGLSYYIESILGDPEETSRVVFTASGAVELHVGTQSNGQGHETVYASFLADQTGIPFDQIRVVQGDSDLIPSGGGTGGSRSVTTQSTATLATAEAMIEGFGAFLAEAEGADPGKVSFDDERFRIPGSNLTPTMLEAAELAREAGRDDLLDHSRTTKLRNMSFPNGAHIAEIEIDPETGVITLERYTVVDDFGNLINPMLAEGQVHGGVVQGLGQALTEHVVYDEDGQLLTATFMDYAMPRADDMPMINFHSEPTPSIYNPMGMKGCGEAGTVGALAAITNAVQDAVWALGITDLEMPFTPHRVWAMLEERVRAAS